MIKKKEFVGNELPEVLRGWMGQFSQAPNPDQD
jgi:hypothetical protein